MSRPKSPEGSNLTIRITAKTRKSLKSLQEALGADSLTEAIRRAADIVLTLKQKGVEVYIAKEGEGWKEVLIP